MKKGSKNSGHTLYTIGHSTRTLEEFIAILKAHGIQALADVRSIPRSRRVPQFNAETIEGDLAKENVKYVSLRQLGGLRKPRLDSPNQAWHNASFRGYADYMQTPEFEAGIEVLMATASKMPTAIMCAEAVPWRCHRSLIGDAMLARGWKVLDLMTEKSAKSHELTSFAKVSGRQVTYPAESATSDSGSAGCD